MEDENINFTGLSVDDYDGIPLSSFCVARGLHWCIHIVETQICLNRTNNKHLKSGLIIDQLVGFLMVESVHPGSSPRLGTSVRIFLDLFQDLTALCFQW